VNADIPGPVPPPASEAILRGLRGRCPACGRGRLFGRFLKVVPACAACSTEYHHHRADDFPPYLVILIVGHLVGYGIYASETHLDDIPLWLHAVFWPTLTVLLSLALLQPVKGAVVALQYALGMHGFGAAKEKRIGRGEAGEADGAVHGRRR
jgi:uncharacterized protein (DUF983 family)